MNRPVKLAYVTTLPVSQWGFLQGQNRYLADNGFEIHAIASPGKFLDKLAERDGSTVHAVPISRTISPLQDLVTLARLVVVLRRIRPDLLHVSTPKAALLGAIAGWVARVPIRVFCFRGSITEPASGWRRRLFRRLEWLTARLCTQTICVSKSLRDFARSESIIGPAEGMVAAHGMSNGINAARFSRDAADWRTTRGSTFSSRPGPPFATASRTRISSSSAHGKRKTASRRSAGSPSSTTRVCTSPETSRTSFPTTG